MAGALLSCGVCFRRPNVFNALSPDGALLVDLLCKVFGKGARSNVWKIRKSVWLFFRGNAWSTREDVKIACDTGFKASTC